MLEKFRSLAIGLCLIVILAGLGAYFMVQLGGGENIFGGKSGDLPPVEFETLTFESGDAGYLLCSQETCPAAIANGPSARFPVSAQKLRLAVADYADAMPTARTFRFDPIQNQFDFTERQPGQALPTVVTVKIQELNAYESALAIYSRKPVGDDSAEDNEKLVNRWISVLMSQIAG
ncbi:MAG: hypothetical protein HWE25_15035 [Alphaproteobacteria bacterium]|nr:hypothetical protein [Alphaproteobacteria bacterium]